MIFSTHAITVYIDILTWIGSIIPSDIIKELHPSWDIAIVISSLFWMCIAGQTSIFVYPLLSSLLSYSIFCKITNNNDKNPLTISIFRLLPPTKKMMKKGIKWDVYSILSKIMVSFWVAMDAIYNASYVYF